MILPHVPFQWGSVKNTFRHNFRKGWAINTIFEAFDTKYDPTLDRNVWNVKPDDENKWRRQTGSAYNLSYLREIKQEYQQQQPNF